MTDNCHFLNREIKKKKSNKRESKKVVKGSVLGPQITCTLAYTWWEAIGIHLHTIHTYTHEVRCKDTKYSRAYAIFAREETRKNVSWHKRDKYIERDNKYREKSITNESVDDSRKRKRSVYRRWWKGKKMVIVCRNEYTSKRRARNRLSTPLGFDPAATPIHSRNVKNSSKVIK